MINFMLEAGVSGVLALWAYVVFREPAFFMCMEKVDFLFAGVFMMELMRDAKSAQAGCVRMRRSKIATNNFFVRVFILHGFITIKTCSIQVCVAKKYLYLHKWSVT